MNTLTQAARLLRVTAPKQRKLKSGIKQMLQATHPNGFNQKLPLTVVKEEVLQSQTIDGLY